MHFREFKSIGREYREFTRIFSFQFVKFV